MPKETYKTMSAANLVERLRADDYVDANRTADIILALTNVAVRASSMAELLLQNRKSWEHNEDERKLVFEFLAAAAIIRSKGIG